MSASTAIVLTTIFEPAFLPGYLDTLRRAGREATTTIYVICDRKTPATMYAACQQACRDGFKVVCPTLEEQEAHLARWELPAGFIPWNTDNRRNIGFLLALEAGCDTLISIDDDNFIIDPAEDFVGRHNVVGQPAIGPVTSSSDHWFNICDLIQFDKTADVFARGFPYYAQRATRTLATQTAQPGAIVAMNAGLWLADPDVDAIYRLGVRPQGQSATAEAVLLAPSTWSPVNTQNTALSREAALTYYYVRMGFPLKGLSIDRFGDIISGYLTQKCIKHVGQLVRLGDPVVLHKRTVHNIFKDLYHELAGIVVMEELLPWLQQVKLSGATPLDAYESLAQEMERAAGNFKGFIWDDGGRDFLLDTAQCMGTWIACIRRIAL